MMPIAHTPSSSAVTRRRFFGNNVTSCKFSRHTSSNYLLNAKAAASTLPALEDQWLAKNMQSFHAANTPDGISAFRAKNWEALQTLRMPTKRNEEYRFTDLSVLTQSTLQAPVSSSGPSLTKDEISKVHSLPEADQTRVLILDGVFQPHLSTLNGLPAGLYVGDMSQAPPGTAALLGSQAFSRGGPFAVINGAAAEDVLVISVASRVVLDTPLHILYLSSGSGTESVRSCSAPRLLLHAAEGSAIEVVEEFAGVPGGTGRYFSCAVSEMILEKDSQVKHSYIEEDSSASVHMKGTLVHQAEQSMYKLTEARLGSGLSRHDVGVEQGGADTHTTLRHFLVAGPSQLHDLHTKLELSHPRGQAVQLHKCIVAHSTGKGVFDGNVKVNKLAQKTDAQQLSRNLLLVPLATVNVKPNLQIIADDVKCTHGCSVSDLREDELFYFRARGIDIEAARRALVSSFGAEVTQQLKYKALMARVQASVAATLLAGGDSSTSSNVNADEEPYGVS
ncbi:hypothetical protein CEUSTIGMA_g5660.t1 [Chlamydomonas eustigma]|uniref:Fe-S cluster assembly protein SufD n=1 Tax=Chlamydomonas eustigma TaxID=1157962 RepID=A0A250X573_9CHLO|nr:hypothetical protein CEUSTIGMA_g5660.t1 [Chlamydomonas eustigma]|eukprot:GAX78218.1 hypothetical protein CEUSTIGMA_g5660.t1 [Chlamydomonas eustigma]